MRYAKADDHYHDEALSSPYSKISLHPPTEQIIHCTMGLKHPINLYALKKAFSDSIMVQHPRFCSLVVRDRGRDYWRKTRVNIDDHFIIIDSSRNVEDEDKEAFVNAYLAELSMSTRLSNNKPLWEVHVLLGLNCIVLRVHHCICDGASLMSMLSACFGKQRDNGVLEESTENGELMKKEEGKSRKWRNKGGVWGWVKSICLTCVFMGKAVGKFSFVKDEQTKISGGDGVELWPRKLETLKFALQDFNSIKNAIPNATINDVLLGSISLGLTKYLHAKSSNAQHRGFKVTATVLVNLRQKPGVQELSELMRLNSWSYGSSLWGNKFGIVLLPIYSCNELHPLGHVKRMKAIMDQKKQSYEPQLFYSFAQFIISCFGLKAISWMTYRTLCNTTLAISNIAGPSEGMAIASNPVTYLRINNSSLPQALVVHMVSYAGMINLQVMVAKDIIPDLQFLVECFRESLLEMKGCIGDYTDF